MSVSSTLMVTPPGTTAPLSATVSQPGEASGSIDPPGPPPPITINLLLTTANQDLVIQILPLTGENFAAVLERQP